MQKTVITVASMLLIFQGLCVAQSTNPDKKLRFGFNVGVNYSTLQATKTPGNLSDVQTSNSAGLRLGVIVDYRLNEHLSISPKAELLLLNDSKVSIAATDASKLTYEVYPSVMEFSAHMMYKLNGEKIKPYFLLGPKFRIPVLDKESSSPQIAKSDLAIDIGFGVDKMFSSFHFAPELRYSYGLINLASNNAIQKMNFHTIALVFNFI